MCWLCVHGFNLAKAEICPLGVHLSPSFSQPPLWEHSWLFFLKELHGPCVLSLFQFRVLSCLPRWELKRKNRPVLRRQDLFCEGPAFCVFSGKDGRCVQWLPPLLGERAECLCVYKKRFLTRG